MNENNDRDAFSRAINILYEREREILKLRMFDKLDGVETGKKLDITKERVRQIEERACEMFRITFLNLLGRSK